MAQITTTKVSRWAVGAVATLAVLWGFHAWVAGEHLPKHVLSRAEAQTLSQQVQSAAGEAKAAAEQADRTNRTLIAYIARQELQAMRDKLERAEAELQQTLLWESNNGENTVSRGRKADLQGRIRELQEQIRCRTNPAAPGCL